MRYHYRLMSPLESVNSLDGNWDDRVLQHCSPRSLFLGLVLMLFLLGAYAAAIIYQAVHHARLWWQVFPWIAVGILCYAYGRIIYRRL
jgi:tryptophan-rich sensory protein